MKKIDIYEPYVNFRWQKLRASMRAWGKWRNLIGRDVRLIGCPTNVQPPLVLTGVFAYQNKKFVNSSRLCSTFQLFGHIWACIKNQKRKQNIHRGDRGTERTISCKKRRQNLYILKQKSNEIHCLFELQANFLNFQDWGYLQLTSTLLIKYTELFEVRYTRYIHACNLRKYF
jgi:hypothetical protein